VQLIFQSAKHTYKVDVPADPRRWGAGTTTSLSWKVAAPPVPGTYKLLLNLPDPRLSTRPDYSIRLANNGTWQSATGYNDLGQNVTVG
jgi:hypothetical protein